MNTDLNKYNTNHFLENKHKLVVNFIVASVPLIVLFDWLFNLGMINLQIGLILKGLSIVFFSHLLIFRDYKIKGFRFKKVIIYFVFLNLIYSFFSENILQNTYYTVRVIYWVFGTLTFYYLYSNNYLNNTATRKMIIYTVLIACFFTIRFMLNSETHQTASAYLLLWCFPLLLHLKQTTITKALILIAIISIIITIKRGAILALIISLIGYFIMALYSRGALINKFKILRIGLLLIGIVAFVFSLVWEKILFRLKDTSGSGRDELYIGIIDKYKSGELHELIFGYGINSTQQYTNELFYNYGNTVGVAAHSDWLQYMFDFGFFGIIFMIILHFQFLKLLFLNIKYKSTLLPMIFMSYIIFSFSTSYSFILNTPDAIYFGILISIINVESRRIQFFKNNAQHREI